MAHASIACAMSDGNEMRHLRNHKSTPLHKIARCQETRRLRSLSIQDTASSKEICLRVTGET